MESQHRILVISSDKNWGETLSVDMAKSGIFRGQVATLPDEAIEILMLNRKFVGNTIQCIVLDMTPQDDKAFTFIKEWQKRELFFNHIPIVGITSNDDISRWDKSMESRLTYYLYNPVSGEMVTKVIHDIVVNKQLKKYTDLTKHLGRYRVVAPRHKVSV